LFSDEERKIVGTAYKQQGKQEAIKLGLGFFGVRMLAMVEQATAIVQGFYESTNDSIIGREILVHCWRGGMRSAAIAWLLDLYGFKVYTLNDGYKAYRNWVLKQFEKPYELIVLGGYTGSNKTALLHELEEKGERVIDLELLASHRGSAFGAIGMPEQPTQEMFENLLATELFEKWIAGKPVWIEDESRRIGRLIVPAALYEQLRLNPVVFLSIPFEQRLKLIVDDYGNFDRILLAGAIERIQKRLGGLETKNATSLLEEGNTTESFRILLHYYDKCYLKGLNTRNETGNLNIELDSVDAKNNATRVLQLMRVEHE
jgi:tRNA 2-selenouridine synthase